MSNSRRSTIGNGRIRMNFESYAASTISKLTNDMFGIENLALVQIVQISFNNHR